MSTEAAHASNSVLVILLRSFRPRPAISAIRSDVYSDPSEARPGSFLFRACVSAEPRTPSASLLVYVPPAAMRPAIEAISAEVYSDMGSPFSIARGSDATQQDKRHWGSSLVSHRTYGVHTYCNNRSVENIQKSDDYAVQNRIRRCSD